MLISRKSRILTLKDGRTFQYRSFSQEGGLIILKCRRRQKLIFPITEVKEFSESPKREITQEDFGRIGDDDD